jgi:hypothetical protein
MCLILKSADRGGIQYLHGFSYNAWGVCGSIGGLVKGGGGDLWEDCMVGTKTAALSPGVWELPTYVYLELRNI